MQNSDMPKAYVPADAEANTLGVGSLQAVAPPPPLPVDGSSATAGAAGSNSSVPAENDSLRPVIDAPNSGH